MKKIISILTLTAFVAFPAITFAAPKKDAATAATPAPKAAAAPATPSAKVMGMYVKVDTIDAKAKNFTHTNKDGTVVKFVITDTTDIKNGEAAAKLEDIKVGDQVSGSRIKKSATEYEVVKVTKFGPKAEKATEEEAKPGPAAAPATPAPGKKK